jgi:hypothetical protein
LEGRMICSFDMDRAGDAFGNIVLELDTAHEL